MKSNLVRTLSLLFLLATCARAEINRDARMAWWREARFGMFVHWGIYSGLAGNWDGKAAGEPEGIFVPLKAQLDTDVYAKAAIPLLKPKAGFAREWTKLAKAAGCQYVVLTTKHHDGFALHDSKAGDFDAGSVLQRDLVKEFVDACRAEGLRVGFYHSLIDWHHDQYEYNRTKVLLHPLKGKPYPNGTRDHARYVDFLHAQVNELVSNYGQVDVMWFDYSAPDLQAQEGWRAFDLINLIRKKQPATIINNRLFRSEQAGWNMATGKSGSTLDTRFGDFITPEQHIPTNGMSTVDWETCMTMNNTWGFNEHDNDWKTSETIIRSLIDITSKGGNFLLNIGPTGDGSVPQPSIDIMTAVGKWMNTNAEAIRGTSQSPIKVPGLDGRITAKGRVHYLHLFSRPADGTISISFPGTKAMLLDGGGSLQVTRDDEQTVIHLPPTLPDPIATVIRLE